MTLKNLPSPKGREDRFSRGTTQFDALKTAICGVILDLEMLTYLVYAPLSSAFVCLASVDFQRVNRNRKSNAGFLGCPLNSRDNGRYP